MNNELFNRCIYCLISETPACKQLCRRESHFILNKFTLIKTANELNISVSDLILLLKDSKDIFK